MVERNNHGHAVLLWLRENNSQLRRLPGHDGNEGWHTTVKGMALLCDKAGATLRDGDCHIHGLETFSQLASIEGSSQRAPEGQHDDRAIAFILALVSREALLNAPLAVPQQVVPLAWREMNYRNEKFRRHGPLGIRR
jgi:hypothetical protein